MPRYYVGLNEWWETQPESNRKGRAAARGPPPWPRVIQPTRVKAIRQVCSTDAVALLEQQDHRADRSRWKLRHLGRLVADQLSARLHQSFIVENRARGGTILDTKALIASPAGCADAIAVCSMSKPGDPQPVKGSSHSDTRTTVPLSKRPHRYGRRWARSACSRARANPCTCRRG